MTTIDGDNDNNNTAWSRDKLILRTIHEMMQDRGMTRRPSAGPDYEPDEPLIFESESGSTMVHFHRSESKFCKDNIKLVYAQMVANHATALLIVTKGDVTSDVNSTLETMGPGNQIFNENSLTYNVTKHRHASVHTRLDYSEKKRIMTAYAVVESQLQAMFVTDPISRYYNYRVGDLIHIFRPKDGSSTYRIVTAQQ